jgi:aromatic ring-opening dioxygenase LigB subunit
MPLIYACIAPHGSETIDKLAPNTSMEKFGKIRNGLRRLGTEVGRAKPDTIVLATPHNLRLWKNIGVVIAENSTGTLRASSRSKNSVSLKTKCDVKFAKELLDRSTRAHLPVVGANYGTSEGIGSDMQMDWGTIVPLWFMIPRCRRKPKLVIVTPSREILLSQNFQFGRVIARVAEADQKKRVVFVASADQAHAHKRAGPYGYSPKAEKYDTFVLDMIGRNRIGDVMKMKSDFVEAAKPDSLWQMTMLAGIMDEVNLRAEFVSYDAPTYFGMICASFKRIS